jgi:AcrR family transcriptional regulator
MPKVSDAYREARRDEIARAAMQRLGTQGFSGTSMADIIQESGMSAGSIYSHFSSKAEIAQHVARLAIGTRADELVAVARAADPPLGPADVISFVLEAATRLGVPRTLLLQVWAEATVDPELRAILDETVGRLRHAFGDAIEPWLRAQRRPADPASIREVVDSMVALTQGFVVTTALFGGDDAQAYLDGIADLLR